jgi:F-type H+-transporting ATPase subunit b
MILTKRSIVLGASFILACAGGALAQEQEAGPLHGGVVPKPGEGITPMIVAIGVFLVVFGILSVKVFPMITKGLKDREAKIRNSIEEAEQAQRQAKAALAQYEQNLAAARAEAQKMLDDAKVQQQAIAAELKAKSDAELAGLRDKAKRDIDAAKSAAIAEIHSYATGMATSIAAKILKREINAQDQQRLVQESLRELQTAGRA